MVNGDVILFACVDQRVDRASLSSCRLSDFQYCGRPGGCRRRAAAGPPCTASAPPGPERAAPRRSFTSCARATLFHRPGVEEDDPADRLPCAPPRARTPRVARSGTRRRRRPRRAPRRIRSRQAAEQLRRLLADSASAARRATIGPSSCRPILERRNDPEVAAAAAQAPEQILVLVFARRHHLPARRSRPGPRAGCRRVKPNLRSSQPLPLPASGRQIPVVVIRPPVVARPKTCVSRSNVPPRRPAPAPVPCAPPGRPRRRSSASGRSRCRRRRSSSRERRGRLPGPRSRARCRARSRPRRSRRPRRCSGRSAPAACRTCR